MSPKLAGIVDQISTLTLLEAADLVEALKVSVRLLQAGLLLATFLRARLARLGFRTTANPSAVQQSKLNIVDIALPAASAAPAAGAGGAAAAPVEEVAAPKEKTVFNVNLTKIDAAQKAKAIREVKALMPSMNLVEVSFELRAPSRGLGAKAHREDAG